jgi:hypothetical protein
MSENSNFASHTVKSVITLHHMQSIFYLQSEFDHRGFVSWKISDLWYPVFFHIHVWCLLEMEA